MAFFKFRKGGDAPPSTLSAPESVEAVRKRARHRLIGSAVLVLIGVVGFPILFDSQPRPIAVDIPIEIPDRNKVKPLGNLPVTAVATQASGSVTTDAPPAPAVAHVPSTAAVETPVATAVPKSTARTASVAAPAAAETKLPEKAAAPISTPTAAKSDDGAKARALLDGKEPEPRTDSGVVRFVVQVGAFSDAAKAREARLKVEKAGLKTYTQIVNPKEGRRTRVRVGPFETRAEADKAAEKIHKLELPATILEL
jgi:DedD protein